MLPKYHINENNKENIFFSICLICIYELKFFKNLCLGTFSLEFSKII